MMVGGVAIELEYIIVYKVFKTFCDLNKNDRKSLRNLELQYNGSPLQKFAPFCHFVAEDCQLT